MKIKYYPLKLNDGGRNMSKRPRQINDCTVRALAIVADIEYDKVYEELAKAGRKTYDGFDLTPYLGHRRNFLGKPFKSIRFRHKFTIEEVLKKYPNGRYVVDANDHVFGVINGIVHDLIREPNDKNILGIWKF